MPKVSVIVPTYNRAHLVIEAIDSVLSQSFQDYELIVVDDGSTDNTKDALLRYGDRIKYIYQTNLGVGAARNVGVRCARGEWLAFLDSDDIWMPEYLTCQMEQAEKNPRVCTHMTNSIRYEADGSTLDSFQYYGIDPRTTFKNDSALILERPLAFMLQKALPYLQATVFRREAFIKAGMFNEKVTITEDLDAIARMCLQGPLSLCNKPLVHVIRRKETVRNLGSRWYSDNMYCRESLSALYENLRSQSHLTDSERRILNRVLGANKKAVGNLYLRNGEFRKARRCYGEAFMLDPSLKSLLKVIVAYLPHRVALACTKSISA